MENINNLELRDESVYPDESVLREILGDSYAAYLKMLELYEANDLTCEWRYYKDGKAWLFKVQKKKRTIVWMSAWKGFMQATLYIPLRLLEEVLGLDIGEAQKEKISMTKNVGKSKPCTFDISTKEILTDLEKVMLFKIRSK